MALPAPRIQPAAATPDASSGAAAIAEAIAIMARLRGPGGCPWDREQTFDTIKRYTLEETYEVFDAIERRSWPDLKDELGDLLLQVLFYAQMASEAGHFTIADVAANLNAKLIRRHPHVFGDAEATDANAVLRNWEQIKREEKSAAEPAQASMLDDVPRTMPAIMEAGKLGSRAAKVGFDWPDAEGLFDKLQEEIGELRAEIEISAQNKAHRMEEELGDLLFTTVNLARHLKLDPESALRKANAKFRERFTTMETSAGGRDALAAMSPAELDQQWTAAKRRTAKHRTGGESSQ
ncbi:nucleoside triphosphate pyrophosphohydrolase [Edaphobacter acidisoli]|uniref:Nucleoside triphosphate pyrophosphohydrolase n=1 Tax=Edaphobacter acidisoli TaxID=2040573 RepID=A0A916W2M3_9BACT|nr:nucleoside triphosphate pyrophosphohydrolase [Edaphobacter acidisoli]GGA61133.1 nucleoside triphosphate pyrophosphohydrolase [Edaphobacter acidisoli]